MTQPSSAPDPGDASAVFDALVETHYPGLCRFAHRLVRSREVAEDIVQDVFAELWCRWPDFDVRDPLPYLFRAVRNRVINHHRQHNVRRRWHDHIVGEMEDRAERAHGATDLEASDLRAAIDRTVDELPDRCRLIFLMSREQDLTYTQIADALGISVKTVEAQMTRALRTLRTRLAGYLGVAIAVVSAWRAGGA